MNGRTVGVVANQPNQKAGADVHDLLYVKLQECGARGPI